MAVGRGYAGSGRAEDARPPRRPPEEECFACVDGYGQHILRGDCQNRGAIDVDTIHGYTTKDSGERARFDSGMQRDTEAGKPRFDLLVPEGVPFRAQFLTRLAELMARGAEKYNDRNWEQAAGQEEMDRFRSSAFRHFMQWVCGETDEDHAAAVVFNLLAYETTRGKL